MRRSLLEVGVQLLWNTLDDLASQHSCGIRCANGSRGREGNNTWDRLKHLGTCKKKERRMYNGLPKTKKTRC